MQHARVKRGSNNCYGEKWKKFKHQYVLSGKSCRYVEALPPRGSSSSDSVGYVPPKPSGAQNHINIHII